MAEQHQVLIIGGGFAGLPCARALRNAPCLVSLLDKRNFHLFTPLLYQVATGGLSPGNIAAPLRSLTRRCRNVEVLLSEALDIDIARRLVRVPGGQLHYDTLVVAAGTTHEYFGHPEWAQLAPGLKTIEDATEIRRRILYAFEAAEMEQNPQRETAWLTFVIVGAGPTGVELAGAISEIALRSLAGDFRSIDTRRTRIILADGNDRVLSSMPVDLSAQALTALQRLGIEVWLDTRVTEVAADHVICTTADGSVRRVETRTVLWAAGVRPSELGSKLAEHTGAARGPGGTLVVNPDFSLPGHPEIFVCGDLAAYTQPDGSLLPGLAAVAMQEGAWIGRLLAARLQNRTQPPFRYRDYGVMATIGRAAAVAQLGKLKLSGLAGWLAWLLIHLLKIEQFENRLLILAQWFWKYIWFQRSTRLITGGPPAAEQR